jgi:hypothetical protein
LYLIFLIITYAQDGLPIEIVVNPPCCSIATYTLQRNERPVMTTTAESRGSAIEEERTRRQEESRSAGCLRATNLNNWIAEDRLQGQYCSMKTLTRWRDNLISRLQEQSTTPLQYPRDLKLPTILMRAHGLCSQKIRLKANGSVCVLIYGGDDECIKSWELIPARS